jgi:hypothetical protein
MEVPGALLVEMNRVYAKRLQQARVTLHSERRDDGKDVLIFEVRVLLLLLLLHGRLFLVSLGS